MSKGKTVYLLYQKDFSEQGNDRYFVYEDSAFSEVKSEYVISLDCFVVTHDFWLISSSLYKKHNKLPPRVVDVVLLSKIVAGTKASLGDVQPWDIQKTVKPIYKEAQDFDSYMDMYYRRARLDIDKYMLFAHKLAEYESQLTKEACSKGESTRFYSLEMPIHNALTLAACRGVNVDNGIIRIHKDALKLDYYRNLKAFAEKHDVMYELPSDGDVREKLAQLGYNLDGVDLDFLIDFLPSIDGFTDDLRSLQRVNKNYRIFNSISYGSMRLRPIAETHWTSTSRIYHKAPNLQNISKKYRNIFIPDPGMALCYVDYDQFEVGIMAALSADPIMKDIYNNGDAYKELATLVFSDETKRSKAKILFLSYTYGMSLDNILRSVMQLGGDIKRARDYFSGFTVFEGWKETIINKFRDEKQIQTISGNFLNRTSNDELTSKECRTAVNHVIQGSATYIFKKALLSLSKVESVELLIPMHDAVLFQHQANFDTKLAIKIFEDEMTSALDGKITGKASIEPFFE